MYIEINANGKKIHLNSKNIAFVTAQYVDEEIKEKAGIKLEKPIKERVYYASIVLVGGLAFNIKKASIEEAEQFLKEEIIK
jgi:hypothetical protein